MMNLYTICLDGNRYEVGGYQNAMNAYLKARAFADAVMVTVYLMDNTTGEIIADNMEG